MAASVIFLLGVFVGLNNFFTSSATAASQNSIALFDKAITYVQNVGSFQMEVFVRTNPEENFFDIHPDKDFIKSRVQLMRQADTVLYRIEREVEHGRVIVCDGKAQYMFVKNGTRYVKGNLGSDFLGMYGNLLYPDRLLQMQKFAIELAGDNTVLRSETDSTIVVVVEGTEWDDNLQEIYATGHRGRNHVTIENVFSKPDGLLRSVKYWLHKDGNKILVLYTGAIQYNPALSRKAITALPDEYSHPATEGGVYDMTKVSEIEDEELAQLQKESPVQTAARLLAAFTSGRAEDVKENLAGYVGNIDKINKRMKGCKFRELRELKVEDYVGVYIVYTLEYPDGATSQMHLALRNDNPGDACFELSSITGR